eukprot:CAMPEP_0116910966 /NCGR_PEP_ID=MMETSP0467-20121206/15198_1 /TAXON_ID=283647 /ORGANISM="Mesodinium pulex, Strain SPMC105" /LENGTH=65 /DNA_ID=CAMNT_0004586641 /DNA_START=971 /DNA_END=1168 /DNA_ORIENTATION=-
MPFPFEFDILLNSIQGQGQGQGQDSNTFELAIVCKIENNLDENMLNIRVSNVKMVKQEVEAAVET